jgi:hypothetical protein
VELRQEPDVAQTLKALRMAGTWLWLSWRRVGGLSFTDWRGEGKTGCH